MNDGPMEYAADGIRKGEWKLEPGTYEVRGTKVVRVDDERSDFDVAASKFTDTLRRLMP